MSLYLVSAFLIAAGVWGHPTPAPRQAPISNQNIHLSDNFEVCLAATSDGNGAAVVIEYCATGGSSMQNWTVLRVHLAGIWECTTGDPNQQWTLSGKSIQWSEESSCLDLTNGNATNGNAMQIWACTDGPNQQWTLTTGPSETITPIISNTTCLTAPTNANGGVVVVQPCDGSTSQLWTAIGSALVVYGDMCLDVTNGNTANGTKLQIWACTPGDVNQQLFYNSAHESIVWASENLCVDLTDGSLANGNQVQMITCDHDSNQNNQIWRFGLEYVYSG
ncbi:ricin B lectin domain-containing protein [Mycena olivaceomarginata]|nr:ricin B lectin domain-containing protein [Mycena olivaceomarginata]